MPISKFNLAKISGIVTCVPKNFRKIEDEVDEITAIPQTLWVSVLLIFIGFSFLMGGSELLIKGGVSIARSFGVNEAVIGLTIFAVGTSLPELAASAMAAFRKHTELALGNVVGSNIFNIIGIIGLVGIINPLQIPSRVVNFDMWVMAAATLIFLFFLFFNRIVVGRVRAGMYLLGYLAYITVIAYGIDSLIAF